MITTAPTEAGGTATGRPRTRRTLAVTAVAALAAGVLVPLGLGTSAVAAPAPCVTPSNSGLAPGEADFDGDGRGDVAYGTPQRFGGAAGGAVVLAQSAAGTRTLTLASTGVGPSSANDGFGTITRAAVLDNDDCTDLVVSAPGAFAGRGLVFLVFGAPNGLGTGAPTVVVRAPNAAAGNRFGAALDTYSEGGDYNAFVLAVGAPGTDVGGVTDAGMVHQFLGYRTDPAGFYRSFSWAQGANGVGDAEKGDSFGEVVQFAGSTLLVGVPREDIGKKSDAGEVDVRSYGTIRRLTQSTKGVAGTPSAGDRFGAAIATSDRTVAVAAPGEKVGKAKAAGVVQLLTQKSAGIFTARRSLTLNTAHVTGAPRTNDRLGTSLAILRGLQHKNGLTVAAGLPQRTVGSVVAAGSVALFELSSTKCPKKATACGRVLTQASPGVAGVPARGANFGASLAIDAGFGPTTTIERRDALLVGTPRSSNSGNGGAYVEWRPTSTRLVTDPAGLRAGTTFGATAPARWTSPSLYR